jgi:hypothetical protein
MITNYQPGGCGYLCMCTYSQCTVKHTVIDRSGRLAYRLTWPDPDMPVPAHCRLTSETSLAVCW